MARNRYLIRWLLLLFCAPLLLSCKRSTGQAFPEGFEQGSKHAYARADVRLHGGLWTLDGALIGFSKEDVRNGRASLRMAPGGRADMRFDISADSSAFSFRYASYGRDHPSAVSLWYSTDKGIQWQHAGTAQAVASHGFAQVTIPLPVKGTVRLSLRNEGAGRVNIDDIDVLGRGTYTAGGTGNVDTGMPPAATGKFRGATRDDNLALGNPSGATTAAANRDNFLLTHPQFTLSYNNAKGIANWVSWHLSAAWRGPAPRCNCFFSDNALPEGFFRATTSAYIATGFDRGHLCPSEDRTATPADNAATFLMSNITPQAPLLNQQPWVRLEEYARRLVDAGNELYIIAGQYGHGGTGTRGGLTEHIAGGRITVPAHFWKIIVVLPAGTNDLGRIGQDTRVIAVDMPNLQSVSEHDWGFYRTSVQQLEGATGYHFFSNLRPETGAALKSRTDNGPTE